MGERFYALKVKAYIQMLLGEYPECEFPWQKRGKHHSSKAPTKWQYSIHHICVQGGRVIDVARFSPLAIIHVTLACEQAFHLISYPSI